MIFITQGIASAWSFGVHGLFFAIEAARSRNAQLISQRGAAVISGALLALVIAPKPRLTFR
jgi:hypothetical protein